MIYFDNSATTLFKPSTVSLAVKHAIDNFGNAGRSFHEPASLANHALYRTRELVAELIGLEDPLQIAFTSSATESLNLVVRSLVHPCDHVITSVAEHNSVLRPRYLSGCSVSYVNCDCKGNLMIERIRSLIQKNTKVVVLAHGSNLTGNINDLARIRKICHDHKLILIADISQTFGAYPMSSDLADIFCFTGHKSLYGPQGTGGIIVNGDFDFRCVKTGGSGDNSFDRLQYQGMPDIFEAGTMNIPGLYGLSKGIEFLLQEGIDSIRRKEAKLLDRFYSGLRTIPGLIFYGDFSTQDRLPIIALNLGKVLSTELAFKLWHDYQIATRAGSHCAPLLHKHFSTVEQGMVRFSFSYFNTEQEIDFAIDAIRALATELQ